MAPDSADADTARASQRQTRRPARIVPAIPHRFSRPPPSARPITPGESTAEKSDKVTQREPEPPPVVEKEPQEHSAGAGQTPLTPDSKASSISNADVEEPVLASSPAQSGDDHVEESLDTRVSETNMQEHAPNDPPSTLHPEPQPAALNGELSPPTAPAEPPPEFHPADKAMAQTPSVGGAESPFRSPSTNPPVHRPQSSVEGIVFGGAVQESPAIPSTPQELELDARASHQGHTRPPPGFAPPQLAPQFFPGHSHHPSDPAATWLYPAYSMAPPPNGRYANGQDYHSHPYPTGPVSYQAPFQGQFSPRRATVAMNGAATSQSQSPTKSQFGEAKPHLNYEDEPRSAHYQNGILSQPTQGTNEWIFKLAAYLSHQLGNPEFADFILQVRSGEAILLSLPVHDILVAHSPVIAETIRRNIPAFRPKDPRSIVEILTNDSFVTPESLNEAVKLLYGAPLRSAQAFLYGLGPYDRNGEQSPTFNEARKRMDQAISYAAAGRVLQIRDMQMCGIGIIKSLLRWDTLDQVLHFGLDASGSLARPDVPRADTVVDAYGATLLDDAISFIAYNFPVDFTLYTIAPELRHSPRLPSLVEFRQPTHNPRLSKIRFGDAPPEDDLKPSYVTQILSGILLSLPLRLLDQLLDHPAAANQLGWSGLVKVMRKVVEEREKRRQKALRSTIRQAPDGAVPGHLLENLYREEHVEPSSERPSGYRLTATRLGDNV